MDRGAELFGWIGQLPVPFAETDRTLRRVERFRPPQGMTLAGGGRGRAKVAVAHLDSEMAVDSLQHAQLVLVWTFIVFSLPLLCWASALTNPSAAALPRDATLD